MNMKKLLVLIICATGIVFLEANPAEPATLQVRAPGGIGTLGDVYKYIQDAIDDANPGDTINVHEGTYTENLVIAKSLHLIGVDPNTTIIDGNNIGNTITITASDVTVSGFGVTGGFGSGNDVFYPEGGIVIDPDGVIVLADYHVGSALTGITIENNIIEGNAGNGVYVSSAGDGGIADNIIIRNNEIFNNGGSNNYAGISLTHPNYIIRDVGDIAEWRRPKNILVEENTVYGNSNYGVYVSAGQDIVIRSNTIYENSKYGIQLASSWNRTDIPCEYTTVEDNEIHDNARNGVKLTSYNHHNTFTGNTINNNGAGGTSDHYKYGFLFQDGNDNTLHNNTITGNALGGLYLWGKGDPSYTWYSTTNNTITGNTISNHTAVGGHGIYIPAQSGYPNSGFLNSNINQNKITNNLAYGLENADTTQTVDATYNWWGDASGPYDGSDDTGSGGYYNPDGLGNEVSDYVDYEPWYGNETMSDRVIVKIGATENVRAYCGTIQAGIDAAHEGDTVVAEAGTYNEYVHITKDGLTIEGAGIDASIIDLDGLTPYWHYRGQCGGSASSSFASRAGVLISGYCSDDEVVEDITFTGFTVKNAGLNPPITATGTHTGPNDVATLTDAGASWTPGELVDYWVHNYGDRDTDYKPARSYGQITANDETTVTATLSGGVENDWDTGDEYVITSYKHYYKGVDGMGDGREEIIGICVANAKNVLIENCKAENCGKSGISATKARCVSSHQYSEGLTVNNCISQNNADDGISVGTYSGSVTITGNTCSNNGCPHVADPTREYTGVGINLQSNVDTVSGTIFNNTCSDNGFEGIIVRGTDDGVIDDVNVEDNDVTGHNSDQDGAGIFLWSSDWYGGYDKCRNVIVKNNTVTGNIRGIIAYNAQQCTFEDNTITTNSGSFDSGQPAIKVDGGNNIEVINNTISSCDGVGILFQNMWDGVAESHDNTCTGNTITGAKFAGIAIWSGAYDNTFTDNTITGTTELTFWEGETYEETQADGVFIDDDGGTGNVFNCNKIYGNDDGDGIENQVTTFVDAENNWWGDSTGPGGVGGGSGDEVSDYVDFFPWLLSEDCNDSTEVVADIVVDDDWAPLPDYTQVFVGDTDYYISLNAFADIQPAVGAADPCNTIYVQDGNYSPFTVDGKTNLTIMSGSTVTVEGVQSVATAYGNRDCVVFVNDSTNVVLQDLNIEGNGLGTINEKSYGVIYENSSGRVKDCNVSPNTIGNMAGTAIGIWDGSDVKVDPTLIHNFGRIGIFIYNGSDVEVLDSEIVGQVYADGNEVNYGIEVEGAWGSDDPATGSRVTIKRNVIYNCDNTFTPEPKWGSSAILVNGWLEYMAAADSTVTIVDNEIYDNYNGIYAIKSPSSRATLNNIYDNRTSGVESAPAYDDSTVVFDAEYNFWGDISGPNDPCGTTETDGTACPDVSVIKNADGLGDGVSENVSYCAWLIVPACTSTAPCPAGDLNSDGCVDFRDVAILALNWLEGCE